MTRAQIAALLAMVQSLVADEPPAVPGPPVTNNSFGTPQVYSGPTVAVTATGVLASGQPRYWPVPGGNESWFSYLGRLCSTLRPDGLPYVPEQYRAQIATIFNNPHNPTRQVDFPWNADAFAYPEEWRTQAQIDQAARDAAGWGESHRRMQQEYSDASGAGGSV